MQVIQEQPARHLSLQNIKNLEQKLKTLQANKDSLKLKLQLRKKQFHLLVQCVHQLQDMLEQEGAGLEGVESEGEAGEEVMEVC